MLKMRMTACLSYDLCETFNLLSKLTNYYVLYDRLESRWFTLLGDWFCQLYNFIVTDCAQEFN